MLLTTKPVCPKCADQEPKLGGWVLISEADEGMCLNPRPWPTNLVKTLLTWSPTCPWALELYLTPEKCHNHLFFFFFLLKQHTFISHNCRGWKSKIKVPADPVCGEGLLPGWQMAAFLYPHIANNRERKQALLSHPTKAWIPFMKVSSSWSNYLPKVPPTNTITLVVRISTYEFRGTYSIHNSPYRLLFQVHGKIYITQFTILTIFKCIIQWH